MGVIDDILAKAKPPETEIRLCLRGDLAIQVELLEEQLDGLPDDGTLAGPSARARELAQRIEDLRAQMSESVQVFRFRGMSRTAYSDLLAKHKPRKDVDEAEVNWSTFPGALIHASCFDPVLSAGEVDQLADVLTTQQWDELFAAAYSVNRLRVDVPKSGRASEILASTARRSRPPEPGESPGGGSSAGSLAG